MLSLKRELGNVASGTSVGTGSRKQGIVTASLSIGQMNRARERAESSGPLMHWAEELILFV